MTPDKWFKFSSNSDNLTMLGNLFPGATVENNRSPQDHSLGLVHGPFKTYRLEIIKHKTHVVYMEFKTKFDN